MIPTLLNPEFQGAQWLSGRVLDSRPRSRGFEPNRHHYVVSLSKIINPSLELVQPRETCPFITERLLMRRKESNQTNKQIQNFKNVANNVSVAKGAGLNLNWWEVPKATWLISKAKDMESKN